ncbi:ATP-binding cassette domain-containing protein [Acidisoma sp. L85]|uniref:ATP-binding cassette domain-containing protein n=1 Tax=Acidisoma sp. L85 TaxID=1641850 RepID=UPI00131B6CA0
MILWHWPAAGCSRRAPSIRGLCISIPGREGARVAVSNVDFEIGRGEVLGLVGESGSGKSLSMMAVMGLLPHGMQVSGSIRFNGEELVGASQRRLRALRGRHIAMVFQDPMTALSRAASRPSRSTRHPGAGIDKVPHAIAEEVEG